MSFLTNVYFWCCLGFLSVFLSFYWSYFEYSDRLNYHFANENQFKCLWNVIRKYYMKQTLDVLVGPTILAAFTLMFLKKILLKFYLIRFMLFFPSCVFMVQLFFLSSNTDAYKQLGVQYQFQFVLALSSVLALFFAAAKTLYIGFVGGIAMSYILCGMIVEEDKSNKKEFTSVTLCSSIGVAFIAIMYMFAKD
jgi:hypothetical protein